MVPPASPYRLEWDELDEKPTSGVVKGPTWDDVRAIVTHLAASPTGFVILSRGDSDFMQVAAGKGGMLQPEYHEPEGDKHFALADGAVDVETVISIFHAWFDNPAVIADHADWEPMAL